jgi:uncharacterized protein (TIGR01732 family)
MNNQNLVDKQVDASQLINAAQYLINGLNKGVIDEKWLEANGLNTDLLDGVETSQLTEATQHVVDGLNNGDIDQQWIEDSLTSDNVGGGSGYAGGFILILVLFILLVIIGAGFGTGG